MNDDEMTSALDLVGTPDGTVAQVHTPIKMRAFLAAYASCGSVSEAARLAGIHRRTHYNWLERDSDYEQAFKAADEVFVDGLEREAVRRATEGVTRLKFNKDGSACVDPRTGEPYVERVYSDLLLIFLLKGRRPERYRDNWEELAASGPQVRITFEPALRPLLPDASGRLRIEDLEPLAVDLEHTPKALDGPGDRTHEDQL